MSSRACIVNSCVRARLFRRQCTRAFILCTIDCIPIFQHWKSCYMLLQTNEFALHAVQLVVSGAGQVDRVIKTFKNARRFCNNLFLHYYYIINYDLQYKYTHAKWRGGSNRFQVDLKPWQGHVLHPHTLFLYSFLSFICSLSPFSYSSHLSTK